jgi:hypothetical protein
MKAGGLSRLLGFSGTYASMPASPAKSASTASLMWIGKILWAYALFWFIRDEEVI